MNDPVGLAVIGCGDVAISRHFPAIAGNPGVRLIACCDRDAYRAESAAREFGADWSTTDVDSVLADNTIHAVIVATPPWVTPGLVKAALRSGKDVLSEKPMALTLEEAVSVREVEATSRGFVQVGFVMRHGPMFGTLRRWIKEGRLGSPLLFRISVFDEVWDPVGDPEHYERIMATLDHGAPCIHDGAHTMDHLHFLTNSTAEQLVSWGTTSRPEFPRPNINQAVIEFAGGHRASVEIGWFLPQFPPSTWSIVGPNGMAWFDQANRSVHLVVDGDEEVVTIDEDWFENCFRHQLETFVEGVRSRLPPEPGSSAGIQSLVLTQAFERGMERSFVVQEVTYP